MSHAESELAGSAVTQTYPASSVPGNQEEPVDLSIFSFLKPGQPGGGIEKDFSVRPTSVDVPDEVTEDPKGWSVPGSVEFSDTVPEALPAEVS